MNASNTTFAGMNYPSQTDRDIAILVEWSTAGGRNPAGLAIDVLQQDQAELIGEIIAEWNIDLANSDLDFILPLAKADVVSLYESLQDLDTEIAVDLATELVWKRFIRDIKTGEITKHEIGQILAKQANLPLHIMSHIELIAFKTINPNAVIDSVYRQLMETIEDADNDLLELTWGKHI